MQPSKPRFWKALLVVTLLAIPTALVVRAAIPAPPAMVYWSIVVAGTVIGAVLVHARVKDDWRAQCEMNLTSFEARHKVGRNVKVGRR